MAMGEAGPVGDASALFTGLADAVGFPLGPDCEPQRPQNIRIAFLRLTDWRSSDEHARPGYAVGDLLLDGARRLLLRERDSLRVAGLKSLRGWRTL